jgi:hypothetical protein
MIAPRKSGRMGSLRIWRRVKWKENFWHRIPNRSWLGGFMRPHLWLNILQKVHNNPLFLRQVNMSWPNDIWFYWRQTKILQIVIGWKKVQQETNFLCGHNTLTEAAPVRHLSNNVGISDEFCGFWQTAISWAFSGVWQIAVSWALRCNVYHLFLLFQVWPSN